MRKLVAAGVLALGLLGCGSSDKTRSFNVPGAAMEPTIKHGTKITADLDKRNPGLGDIVVFHPPAGADSVNPVCGNRGQGMGHAAACSQPTPQESTQVFVKRVVGLPGDKLSIVKGEAIRNGKMETGSYVGRCPDTAQCTFRQTITIPAGDYYMLGDNRDESDDSRFWGPVPKAYVIGTVDR